eukprot:GHVT01059809.1.p1 GENE.GHVT01059809.1~~GHVT01059809.1.p1  ORF type:complete len:557 (-),score=-38.71 GHVT01059809.1:104-1774(-)
MLADKFGDLYQSVPYDVSEMNTFKSEINKHINHNDNVSSTTISVEEVEKTLKSIKYSKDIMSDHFKYGTNKLFQCIASLLTSMVKHGFSQKRFTESTIMPIPKNMRKSLYDSNNYRSIALGSILCKVLDHIVMFKYPDVLGTSDMQFGFKPQHSTNLCTFVLNEVVQYYANNNTPVNGIFLDASKAFDKVHYIKLFKLLLKKGMCPVMVRFLLNSYTNQSMSVKWKNEKSKEFNICNGVKQGGVLSPILFSIYFDELLYRLEESGVGCYVGNKFLGALAYADDVVLLAPTTTAANVMLEVAQKFASDYNVTFNATKTKHVLFNDDNTNNVNVKIGSANIQAISAETHLGNTVGKNYNNVNIKNSIKSFNSRVNGLLANFSHCDINIKYKLFKTYCMPLYGSQLWDISHLDTNYFFVTWRKAIRKILRVPYNTHCALLPYICRDLPVDTQIHSRTLKFLNNIFKCSKNNNCVKTALNLMLDGSKSSISNSVSLLCKKYNVDRFNICVLVNPSRYIVDTNLECIALSIREMIDVRDNRAACVLTREEATNWVNALCTQ